MRITMNIEDGAASSPEVKVETGRTTQVSAADQGTPIDAGPPTVDFASLSHERGGIVDNDDADIGADSPNVMGNGSHAGDMNDGGRAPATIPDESDDSLLH